MRRLKNHEFIDNGNGELALLVHVLNDEFGAQATFIAPRSGDTALIEQGGKLVYEVPGINHDILDRLQEIDTLLVIEMAGKEIARTTDIQVVMSPPPYRGIVVE